MTRRPDGVATDAEHAGPTPVTRGPLLLADPGDQDHTVPDVVTRSTPRQNRDPAAVTKLQGLQARATR